MYLLLAIPTGRLADAVGRTPVFLAGYALLAAAYLPLLGVAGGVVVLVSLPLLGAYYAATDGVLMALATRTLPGELLTTGPRTADGSLGDRAPLRGDGVRRPLERWGPELAVQVFLTALLATLLASPLVLRRRGR